MSHVLVIDDDRSVLHLVKQAFADTDVRITMAASAADGLAAMSQERADVVLLDITLPESSGLEMFERIRQIDAKVPIIFITAGGSSEMAIEAMKMGAHDYIHKPLDIENLRTQVGQALETRRLMQVPVGLPDSPPAQDEGECMIGHSPAMLDVYKAVGRVASQDVTVLILGESGTGKELIARAIYHHSNRAAGPFLAVNCAALTETLLESELFGHEKGSFTGADRRRIGKFEQCDGGTIFLDEIGDMSPPMQAKVLRVLQQQQFERVGGSETIQANVRVIAATNRDLEKLVGENKYRADLFYRLNGYTIMLPPLRDRGDDLVLLIDLYLGKYARQMNKEFHGVAPAALELLKAYNWPGNIRELQNVLRKALLQASSPIITPDCLPTEIRGGVSRAATHTTDDSLPDSNLKEFIDARLQAGSTALYAESLAMVEAYLVTRVLRLTKGNQSRAAHILGITRGSLRNKIHTLGVSIGQVVRLEEEVSERELSTA